MIEILECFKPLFTNDYTYYVYYGGRGGGKTEGIAQTLVILARLKKLRILCIRENQNSIADSVKAVIEEWINKLGLTSEFIITREEIRSINGSVFLFKGMKSSNAVNIKSIAKIDITWVEEAEAFSKRSWSLLIPSVTRTEHPKIIVSFNPQFVEDVVYDTFLVKSPPPRSYICKINHRDNPYFKHTNLEDQRLHDLEVLPNSEYMHKWEGELRLLSEDCLWSSETFASMISNLSYNRDNYMRIVVSVDPATTHKEHSNEYGICVLGITRENEIHLIEDKSGVNTPHSFAILVSKLYEDYKADCVVVETNQGGDFLKSTLITYNPTLHIREVRANRDKISRALPVANLAAIGRIKHINGGCKKIEDQMKLMTNKGFMGPKGASPDAVDAYVWGIYELAGLRDVDTENTFFLREWFRYDAGYNFPAILNNWIVGIIANEASIIKFDVMENRFGDRKIFIKDCILTKTEHLKDQIKSLGHINTLYIPDIVATQTFETAVPTIFYDIEDRHIDEIVMQISSHCRANKIIIGEAPIREYENLRGELIYFALDRFKLEEKVENPTIRAFVEMVKLYF